MNKAWIVLLTSAVAVSGSFAATSKTKTKPAKAKAALICPVTGDKIPSKDKAAGHSVYKGVTYYFCCSGCKPMFDKNPSKYISKMKSKDKADKNSKHGSKEKV
jgi:YHS domain-containing protein